MNGKTISILLAAWLACCAAGFSQTDEKSEKSQQYQGPSIISRDTTLIGERGGKLIDFRLYASVTGVYDSGLTPVSTDQNGQLISGGGNYGVEAGFGILGSRTWRRDSLSLDYHGAYRHYTTTTSFGGLDQFLNLRYGRTLTRRVTLDIKETGGITNLGNGSFSYLPLTSNDLHSVPTNELFDNKTEYSQSRVGLVWQKTARLSFEFDGEGSVVRRKSTALAGLNGYTIRGDMSYRITRRQTLSFNYDFTSYDFQRTFGDARVQTGSLGYSLALGKRYDLGLAAGATYADIRGLQSVAVDPAIVAIIGQATIVENFQRFVTVPHVELRLTRRFKDSSIAANANTGVSPGNGVYLTSRQTVAGAQYSYLGHRRFAAGAKFDYTQFSTLGQSLGKYQSYQGGVGGTYKVANSLHMELRYDYRHYTTQNNLFQKDSHRISLGLAFSPGERPLAIW